MNYKSCFLTATAFVSIVLLQESCTDPATKKMKKLNYLVGTWESKNEDGILYETWKQVNDSTYEGHAYAISNSDTTFSENTRIVKHNDDVIYSVTTSYDETTDFKLVSDDQETIFENKEHDYPQRIIYSQNGKDSLYARIEGLVDGGVVKEEFRYSKVKR